MALMKKIKVVVHPPGYAGNFIVANGILNSASAYRPHHHLDDYKSDWLKRNEYFCYLWQDRYIDWTEEQLEDFVESTIAEDLYVHRSHNELRNNAGRWSTKYETMFIYSKTREEHEYRVWLSDIKKDTIEKDNREVDFLKDKFYDMKSRLIDEKSDHVLHIEDPDFDLLFEFFDIREEDKRKAFVDNWNDYEEKNKKLIDRFGWYEEL